MARRKNERQKRGERRGAEGEKRKGGIWEKMSEFKGHLRGSMETYYSRRILKIYTYMEESKWSHQIKAEIVPQLP